jgi:hypothetical protein
MFLCFSENRRDIPAEPTLARLSIFENYRRWSQIAKQAIQFCRQRNQNGIYASAKTPCFPIEQFVRAFEDRIAKAAWTNIESENSLAVGIAVLAVVCKSTAAVGKPTQFVSRHAGSAAFAGARFKSGPQCDNPPINLTFRSPIHPGKEFGYGNPENSLASKGPAERRNTPVFLVAGHSCSCLVSKQGSDRTLCEAGSLAIRQQITFESPWLQRFIDLIS